MVDRIHRGWDNAISPIGIFIDLSKAFDCINHKILFAKLEHIGIRDTALKLIMSYMRNRKQLVDVNGSKSDYLEISIGVPQGSILGPLLFLIYVNDLILSSSCVQFVMFADDTTILYNPPTNRLLRAVKL